MTSAAPAHSMPSTIAVTSDLLGTLTVEPSAVITFPKGLLGFPECRGFVLLLSERDHVYWLQSVDHAALAFLMIDPFVFFDGYTVDLAATEVARSVATPDDVTVLAIVTLPQNRANSATANLQGPVVISTRSAEGCQVVIADGRHGVKENFQL